MFNTLVKQLLLLVFVTCVVTWALTYVGIPVYIGAILGLIAQFTLYNAYVYGIDAYTVIKAKNLEVEKLKQLSYQGMEVECPCQQKNKQFVPIRLNTPNYYKCKKCSKVVGVFTATETALVTEPIADTDLKNIENLLENKLNENTR